MYLSVLMYIRLYYLSGYKYNENVNGTVMWFCGICLVVLYYGILFIFSIYYGIDRCI